MHSEHTRRLAAVWFADIVGYTTLASRDEDAALGLIKDLQSTANRSVEAHNGRIVKHMGDAVLAVFDSIEAALRSAVELRDAFAESGRDESRALRVGVHIGEVVETRDGDVYGDGVNVASRLQVSAEPDQILFSDAVHQQIRHRSVFDTESLGTRTLKGIDDPISVHAVVTVTREGTAVNDPDSGTASDAASLVERLGRALGRHFDEIEPVGAGGMGTVFGARDVRLNRPVAIKVLSPKLATSIHARHRFRREAQALAALRHSNLVSVYSVDELEDGTPFFLMERVGEDSLSDVIERADSVSIPDAQRFLEQIARGISAIHAGGLIHRDIKSANVLVDDSGQALVSDFGIVVEEDESDRFTSARAFLGSPEYMSPEQAAGDPVDHRTDLYSFGVLAFQLLAGRLPFEAGTVQALVVKHISEDPPSLSDLRPDCPHYLEELVGRCLQKERGLRFQTADEIVEILDAAGSGHDVVVVSPLSRELSRDRRRVGLLSVAAIVAVVLELIVHADVTWSLLLVSAALVYSVDRFGSYWVTGVSLKAFLGVEEPHFVEAGSRGKARIQPFQQLARQCRAERALLLASYGRLARSEQAELPRLRGAVDHLVARAAHSARELHALKTEERSEGQYDRTTSREDQDRLGNDVSAAVKLLRSLREEVSALQRAGRQRGTEQVQSAVEEAVVFLGEDGHH